MKRTVSAVADGVVCIGGKAVSEGLLLIKDCTKPVPHYITLFVELEANIVPEISVRICWLIDQRSEVLPVGVAPCVCFGAPQSV